MPWAGIDPITVASQIVLGLQTVVSRQLDLTKAPAVVTIGSIHGGVRGNIIPDSVVLVGTVRTLDPDMRTEVEERIRRTASRIAEAAGAEAQVSIATGLPITYNDPALTRRMVPSLEWAAGRERVSETVPWTAAEDFSFYQQEVPGLFVFLGIVPDSVPLAGAPANHSPHFFADEAALPVGVRVLAGLAVDFLATGGG
jgi:amidohydrolase